MTTETFTGLLLFVGGIVAAVLFVLDRQGKRLADSIPPELLPVLLPVLTGLLELAKTTPTTLDDDLIKQLIAALTKPPVTPEPSPFATRDELAARLDPQAQG